MWVCEYLNVWVCVCMSLLGMKCIMHIWTKAFVSENVPISKQGSLLMRDCTSMCLVSSLWEYIMAKEHVCLWEDKLKQDVLAPRSFEGVPHHTSDSVEGRSTTIKGHSVYLNLPVPACQMFQSFSFISLHEPSFYFCSKIVTHFAVMRKKKKSQLSSAGGRRG